MPPDSRICLSTDTRVSRDVVKTALISGLLSVGTNVTDLGILPTPALALLTAEINFDAGIMITASHNPALCNGINLFNHDSIGFSADQEEIESFGAAYSGSFDKMDCLVIMTDHKEFREYDWGNWG
jgi:Phosphomannomutase